VLAALKHPALKDGADVRSDERIALMTALGGAPAPAPAALSPRAKPSALLLLLRSPAPALAALLRRELEAVEKRARGC
jgi:hypothetical protein